MLLTRKNSLSSRLPADVRERLTKAGVDDVEWYAGRIEEEGPTFSPISPDREQELRQRDTAHRRARSAPRAGVALAALRRVTAWTNRRHAPRRADS